MKIFEYIIAREIMDFIKETKKNRRNEEIRKIKDSELKLDKGYWKYVEKDGDLIYVKPKINEHFVLVEEIVDEKTVIITVSKKPFYIESYKLDFPWEAEGMCKSFADSYRSRKYKVIIKRKAPIFIADYDICCPFCLNSQPLDEWINNSYKQEFREVPDKYKELNTSKIVDENININHIETEKIWCPICNNGIDNKNLLMKKGDEWKISFIKNSELPNYISPFTEKLMKEKENK